MVRFGSRRRSRTPLWLFVVALLAAAVYLATSRSATSGSGGSPAGSAATPQPASTSESGHTSGAGKAPGPPKAHTSAATYLAELGGLAASSERYVAGYTRAEYGDGWKDPDRNGCDTRNDILARDLAAPAFKSGTHDCIVVTGTLHDVYTGTIIDFQRGNVTSEAVQIDHIVPLSWAWPKGAAGWSADKRLRFANDPRNLIAVDGPTNGAKSDSGPAEWMPPASGFSCSYVEAFVTVLAAYDLAIDVDDRSAIRAVLAHC